MADSPRKDNVVKFRKIERPPPPGAPRPEPGAGLRRLIKGREGYVWWALIILIAIALVAWQRVMG